MDDFQHQPDTAKLRRTVWGLAVAVLLVLGLVAAIIWSRSSNATSSGPYADVPFRPKVTYDGPNVHVTNTEAETYFDTSLNIYVDAVLYRVEVGDIRPNETVTRSFSSLKNDRGEGFSPEASRTSELEVRARFRGYRVHKDFPPPAR